jgi:hypothetical protein
MRSVLGCHRRMGAGWSGRGELAEADISRCFQEIKQTKLADRGGAGENPISHLPPFARMGFARLTAAGDRRQIDFRRLG